MPSNIQNQFLYQKNGVEVWLKRLEIAFPEAVGNKYFKLKYNLQKAKKENHSTVLTFGGAFSNHIAATASICNEQGLKSIGVIRGAELGKDLNKTLQQNPTLEKAVENGMQLRFISRKTYRQKNTTNFINQLKKEYGNFYLLSEGGTNDLAIKGCREILSEEDKNKFDVICCPVGTGGTLSGIVQSATACQTVLGYVALNADLSQEIQDGDLKINKKLFKDTNFGGFGKINKDLISFINRFAEEHRIQLDPIYTGKMMYVVEEQLKNGFFEKNNCILAIHTGGLQGIKGMNRRLRKKNLPLINYLQ